MACIPSCTRTHSFNYLSFSLIRHAHTQSTPPPTHMSCHNLFCVFYAAGRTIVRSCHLQHSKQKKKKINRKVTPNKKKWIHCTTTCVSIWLVPYWVHKAESRPPELSIFMEITSSGGHVAGSEGQSHTPSIRCKKDDAKMGADNSSMEAVGSHNGSFMLQ